MRRMPMMVMVKRYEKKGRLEESLESYQKSVKLNPENQTGLNSITELEEEMGISKQ